MLGISTNLSPDMSDSGSEHNTPDTEVTADEDWVKTWNNHMYRLRAAIRCTAGCGARAQFGVDREYDDLATHYELKPEGVDLIMPKRPVVTDDGSMGMRTGLAVGVQHMRGGPRAGDIGECSIQ